MDGDLKSKLILLLIFAIIGAGFLIADFIILIRWILYYYARSQATPIMPAPIFQEPPQLGLHEQETAPVEMPLLGYDLPESPPNEIPPSPYPISPDFEAEYEEQMGMPRRPFARTWSLTDPFIAIQVVILLGNILAGIPLIPLILKGGQEALFGTAGILIQVIATVLLNVLFVAVVVFYLHRYGTTLKEIGLRAPTPKQIGIGIGLGLALAMLAQGAEIGMGFALPHILPKSVLDGLVALTKELTAGGMFDKIPSLNLKILFALAGAIAAPIGEEVFFRGFLYNALKRRLNVTAGIIISGLLFALLHLGPLAIVIIFPMGMALAYVYEKTGSLWVTILMHAVNNGLAFAIGILWPHLGEDPAKKQDSFVPPPTRPAVYRTVPMSLFEGSGNPALKDRKLQTGSRRAKIALSVGRV